MFFDSILYHTSTDFRAVGRKKNRKGAGRGCIDTSQEKVFLPFLPKKLGGGGQVPPDSNGSAELLEQVSKTNDACYAG